MKKLTLITLISILTMLSLPVFSKEIRIDCKQGNNWLYVWNNNTGWTVMEAFPSREITVSDKYIVAIGKNFNNGSPDSEAEFKSNLDEKSNVIKFKKY